MKKILLFSACVVLAFASCKKDSAKKTASTSITATIDGSNMNFSTGATAQSISEGGIYSLQIIGDYGSGTSAQGIVVAIETDKPIVKGTYSTTDTSSIIDVTYVQNTSTSNPVSFSTVDVGSITITSISGTNVQGTFSGTLVSDQDNTTTKTVTNGKFNVGVVAGSVQVNNSRLEAKMQAFKNRVRN